MLKEYLIRLAVEPGDEERVSDLFLAMLQHLAQWGHDMAPTRENADRFTRGMLLPAAHRRDPVLLVFHKHDLSEPIAAIFWVRHPDDSVCVGFGTYVKPEHQRRGVGTLLREAAVKRLRELGVKKVIGSALQGNDAGHASLMSMGMKATHTVYSLNL
jgi:GNAT superfamily N-acetyltransferase